ncbi:MAG: PAS domain S-box protein [Candidatus Accumulibacter sp.]|uniref:sensor domain-containing protein n=1 Tax=Accumulibacter sp. TaxID=2053492 RepID=UPI00287AAAFD|nr:PAS domain S-box protein [Accumulibacter sp.]MDS4016156.1 PAS domain S-box protein [Accumulibacter sp.]
MKDSGILEQELAACRAILDCSGIAVVYTRRRRIYHCNARAEELFGWPPGTLVGQSELALFPSLTLWRALCRQTRSHLLAGQTAALETHLARRDRSTLDAHLIVQPGDPLEPRTSVTWIIRDISDEVRARATSARLLREQQLIFQNAETGIVVLRDRVIQRCNRRFAELLGYAPDELIGQSTRIYYPSDTAWLETGDKAYREISETGIYRGDVVFHRRDGEPFCCQIIGSMIKPGHPDEGYVWLYEDVTEKRRAASALHALLREQTLIFERAPIGIAFLRERVIRRCNPSFERMFGYQPGELIGCSTRVIFQDEAAWLNAGESAYRVIDETGKFVGEIVYRKADGTPLWCQVTGSLFDPAKREEGHVYLFEDITARRAAEEALVESLWEQQLIFDNAMIGISYQRERTILRCNRRLEEIFGYPAGGLSGRSTRILFPSDEAWEDAARQIVERCAVVHGTFDGELMHCRHDGTPIWVHLIGRAIGQKEDGDVWIWTYEDVTAHRAAQQALRDSHLDLERRVAERTLELEQQLHFMRQLIEAIPGPVFYKNWQGRYLGCNQAFLKLIGRSREEVIGASVYDLAPRELAERYQLSDKQLLEKEAGSLVYESRVVDAEGNFRDVIFHKATYGGPGDSGGGVVGVMLDITERKRMEVRLRQAATVFDSSAEGITITSPDAAIIAVNRAFTEITGYREDEVIGRNPRFLQSGLHGQNFYREMWETLALHGRWQGEVWNRRKDGQAFLESLTISAVKDNAGVVTHYVGVFSDITELRKAHDRLDHQAHHDPLTGLPNRLLLGDRLHKALQRAHRDESGLAVFFIDLDRFKNINDTLGHQVGDRVLCEVAWRLSRLMRESDTVGRLGGDEFLIIIEDISDPSAASHIAENILDVLQNSPVTVNQEFFVGASIGISVFPQDGVDAETLMKNADVAMYRAKERGRNTYEFFTGSLTQSSLARLRLETDLRRALERDELRVYLQPQVSLATGRVLGAEALVRWLHPAQGMLLPPDFIRLAEESGLIVQIGEWVQQSAMAQWAAWSAAGLAPGVLSINVSGLEFARGRIQETARKALEASGLSAQLLELEITEGAIMSHAENSLQVLSNLRAMGLRVVIDDFGTGYSSLAHLKRLPLDKLKVDRSFVHGLPNGAEDCAITRAVIGLAHSLQLTVIAEGVERDEQRDFLAREGCDEIQGYLTGQPMPFADYERSLLRR